MTKRKWTNRTKKHTPLDKGVIQKSIEELLREKSSCFNDLTFMSPCKIPYDPEELEVPKIKKSFSVQNSKIFSITIGKNMIEIALKANFEVTEVKECSYIHNHVYSNPRIEKYYLVTVKTPDGKYEKDIKISGNSKSDFKKFQEELNSKYNNLTINMSESEFKTFFSGFIASKFRVNILTYKNPGMLDNNKFLYRNALVSDNSIIYADKNGYMKTSEDKYIKLDDTLQNVPMLIVSKKSPQLIAKNLMTNIIECWDKNFITPLFALGHMTMAIHFKEFIRRQGVPPLIIFGETSTGKSTIVMVGMSIFGMPRESLLSGGSTTRSNEYLSSRYNGINICIDDIKGNTLMSASFTEFVKTVFKGTIRTRMKNYGKEVDFINICSPLVYSTNERLPNLKEVSNRLNIVEMFGDIFKAEKFNYHESNDENLKELSLILPELIKYPIDKVLEIHNDVIKLLEKNISNTKQRRMFNNLAYGYTGLLLLLKVADMNIDGLEEKFLSYASTCVEKYKDIKDIVEQVLEEIPILINKNEILQEIDYKFETHVKNDGTAQTIIWFNKKLMIANINKFYGYDKTKYIDEKMFSSYLKNHPRFVESKTVRIKNPTAAIGLDVSDLEEFTGNYELNQPISFGTNDWQRF